MNIKGYIGVPMHCKVCSSATSSFGSAKVLCRYDVSFFCCDKCGFIQSEEPYWLEEAYRNPLALQDVGLVCRNGTLSRTTALLLSAFFPGDVTCLDYGGGNGMFVRMMRDSGYDFRWQDKYAKNEFAHGHVASSTDNIDLVTAWEVFEHLPRPMDEIEQMLCHSKSILFSTLIKSEPRPPLDQWWYYSLESGQHISFYTVDALKIIAQRFNLNLYSNGVSIHLFTPKKLSGSLFRLYTKDKIGRVFALFNQRKSLLAQDYERISGKQIN